MDCTNGTDFTHCANFFPGWGYPSQQSSFLGIHHNCGASVGPRCECGSHQLLLFFISSALFPASWCSHWISIIGSNLCLHVTANYSPPTSPHKTKCLWAVGQYPTPKGIVQHGPLASLHSCDLLGFAFPRRSWRSKSNMSVPLLRLRAVARSSWRMRM